jgi:hypothetical protein
LIQPSRVRDEEEKPHPTIARGAGQSTNLAFPDAREERRKRGGGA